MSSDDEVGSEDDDDEKESDREEGEAPAARADAKPAIDNALLKCLELYPSAYPLPFVGGGDDAWEDAYSDMPRTLIELKMCELRCVLL